VPGSPVIHNIMPTFFLGTTATAAWKLGIVITAITLVLEVFYMNYLRKKFKKKSLGFDLPAEKTTVQNGEMVPVERKLPSAASGLVCLLLVILCTIFLGGVIGLDSMMVVCSSLAGATILNLLWTRKYLPGIPVYKVLEEGTTDGIIGHVLCAAVLGFVGVVQATSAFGAFANWTNGMGTSIGYLGIFFSITLMAATTGNSPGTLNLFLSQFAQNYVSLGMNPQVVHRLASTASMGFDVMPHNPGTIVYLRTFGLSYREAYIDVFIACGAIPAFASFCGGCIAYTGFY
jgi:H+/gluconate symporter-like permease